MLHPVACARPRTMSFTVAYDARPLQPETRHWGPGVCVQNILQRLSSRYDFVGVPARLPAVRNSNITRLKRAVRFDISPWFAPPFDVYWGTNDYLPLLLRTPSVATVHDLLPLNGIDGAKGIRAKTLRRKFAASVRKATKLVADSRTTADDLLSRFPELASKMEIGLLGFDMPGSTGASCAAPSQRDGPYLVMLGSHTPRKNLPLALAAVKELRSSGAKIPLFITGNIHPVFRATLEENSSEVRSWGVLPKKEVFTLLQNASALLFPSLYEGFGFPVLEAMAAGCPVLALDTPINREIGGNAAWLLQNDPRLWAKAIRTLMSSSVAAAELREKGYENLKRFSWDKTAQLYGEIFKELAR